MRPGGWWEVGSVPAYDYECSSCRQTFEVRQRISDAPLSTCPQCGGSVRRLLSAATFILKGGGWYVTDYPSEARKKGVESEKKESEKKTAEATPTAASSTPATPTASTSASSTSAPSKD